VSLPSQTFIPISIQNSVKQTPLLYRKHRPHLINHIYIIHFRLLKIQQRPVMENEDKKNNNNNNTNTVVRKPRFLCLHGFRTSGEIMKKQIHKWPQNVLDKLDLVFVDAPFPCNGKSDVEGIFDPPYYEWFQFNKVLFLIFFL
jgi:hypothetical protein